MDLKTWEIKYQFCIPRKLDFIADMYPELTWKDAQHLYVCAVEETLMELKISNLRDGYLGNAYEMAAKKFINKVEEKMRNVQ